MVRFSIVKNLKYNFKQLHLALERKKVVMILKNVHHQNITLIKLKLIYIGNHIMTVLIVIQW